MSSGGFTGEKPMDKDTMDMVMAQKAHIESKAGKSYSIFVPVSYTTQVVAGINYKVRVAVNDGKNIIVTIFQDLPHNGGAITISDVKHS